MRQIFLVRSRLLEEQATLLSRQSQKQTFFVISRVSQKKSTAQSTTGEEFLVTGRLLQDKEMPLSRQSLHKNSSEALTVLELRNNNYF